VPQRPAAVRILGVALRLFHGVVLVLRSPDLNTATPPPPVRVIPPLSAMAICATPAAGLARPAGPPPVAPSPPPPLSLYVGERRTLEVRVENVGAIPVTSASLRLTSSEPGLVRLTSVTGAASLDGPIPPGSVCSLCFDVVADLGLSPAASEAAAAADAEGGLDRAGAGGEESSAAGPGRSAAVESTGMTPRRIGSEDSTGGRDGPFRCTQRTATVSMVVEHSADALTTSPRLLRASTASLSVVVRPALVVESASAVVLSHRTTAVSPAHGGGVGQLVLPLPVGSGGAPPLALCLQVYNLASVVLHVRLVRRHRSTTRDSSPDVPADARAVATRAPAGANVSVPVTTDDGGDGSGSGASSDGDRCCPPPLFASCLVEHGGSVRLLAPLDPPPWTEYATLDRGGAAADALESVAAAFLYDTYELEWAAPSLGRDGIARLRAADSSGVGREATRMDRSLVAALHRPGVALAFVVDDERQHLLPLENGLVSRRCGSGGDDGLLADSDDEGAKEADEADGLLPAPNAGFGRARAGSGSAVAVGTNDVDGDSGGPAGVILSTRRYHTVRLVVDVTGGIALPPSTVLDVRLGQADLRCGPRPVDTDGAVAFVTGALHGVAVGRLPPGGSWSHAVRLRFESDGAFVLDATLRLGGGGSGGGGKDVSVGSGADAAGADSSRASDGLLPPTGAAVAARRRRDGVDGVVGSGRASSSRPEAVGGDGGGSGSGGGGFGVAVRRRLAIRAAAPPGYGAWNGATPKTAPAVPLLPRSTLAEQPSYNSVMP